MSRVEIFRLNHGGVQDVIAEFRLVGDEAIGQGNEKFVQRLKKEGVLDKTVKPPVKVYPNEGSRFLNLLQSQFNSGYLIASSVIDGPIEE